MFNIMFVYYDLVDEDKISADEYRAMLIALNPQFSPKHR